MILNLWRVLLSAMATSLAGAMITSMVTPRIREVRWETRAMVAILLVVVAILQIGRIGQPLRWTLPAISVAVILGWIGVLRTGHKRGPRA